MYIILSPNSTTIFGWWKIEKKLKVFGLDTLEQPLHQSYSSSEPWTIIHFVTTIYLSRKPSLMVKSLLLMVKLPRIHNKNHQRFYTKNYPTLPNHSPSFALDLLKDPQKIEDFPGRSGLPRKSAVPSTSASKPFILQDSQAFGPGPFASAGVG